jgi:response regulator RpfG family c-di-GMP phosphodiesterase
MSQTILIESNDDLKKLFSLNLTTYTGTDVVLRTNAKDAIELLKILPSISLIITNAKTGTESTAVEIYQFLKSADVDIPMIVLGECSEISHEVLSLNEPISWELLIKKAGELLGVTNEEIREKVKPNFVPISINYFFEIDHTPCEVYIRIKKSQGEYQFVKRIHEQDSFTAEDIEKYLKQGLKNFYIEQDYIQYFVTFVTNSIISRLEGELPLINRLSTNASAYEIVREHIQKVGLSDEISELAEVNIQSMIKAIQEAPKLSNLLKLLFTSKISYAYQKSHLVCVIGNFIMSKQSWYAAQHLETLTYLSFFSDITLKSAKQLRINSNEDLEIAELSTDEKKQVLTHSKDASNLLKESGNTNEDIELTVLQHQGQLDGIGFPEQPSDECHPIAKVFIISDAFVKTMLDPSSAKSKKEILTILYLQFSSPSYQKIIKVLEQKIE